MNKDELNKRRKAQASKYERKHERKYAQSFQIGPGHKGKQKTEKLYKKGKSTDNPNEKDAFLKRTGPQLPLAQRRKKKRNA